MKLIIFYGGSQDGRFLFVNELPPEIRIATRKSGVWISADRDQDPEHHTKIEVYVRADGYRYIYSEKKSD